MSCLLHLFTPIKSNFKALFSRKNRSHSQRCHYSTSQSLPCRTQKHQLPTHAHKHMHGSHWHAGHALILQQNRTKQRWFSITLLCSTDIRDCIYFLKNHILHFTSWLTHSLQQPSTLLNMAPSMSFTMAVKTPKGPILIHLDTCF